MAIKSVKPIATIMYVALNHAADRYPGVLRGSRIHLCAKW